MGSRGSEEQPRGELTDLEVRILEAALELRSQDNGDFHAYQLAKVIKDKRGRKLVVYGTLYKALSKLRDRKLVDSWWEDPEVSAEQRRAQRRMYKINGDGILALNEWARSHAGAFRWAMAGAGG
jgi:DNA-binding PadR family transcriptional regulator